MGEGLKVLVTGGTGFLGQHVVKHCANLGWDVIATGRNQSIGTSLEQDGVKFVQCDLRNEKMVQAAVQGVNAVIHCAALSSPWGKYADFYEVNVRGTQTLVDACIQSGVYRFVHISSSSVCFCLNSRLNVCEADSLPPKASSNYSKTKRMAENVVIQAANRGLQAITLRPRGIFGPMDTSMIPRLLEANLRGGIPMIDHGSSLIDVTYVDNMVLAIEKACLLTKSLAGETFHITNGEPMMLKDLLLQLATVLGMDFRFKQVSKQSAYFAAGVLESFARITRKEPVLTRYTVSLLAESQTLNIDKAIHMLGYVPRVAVRDGIEHFAWWWRNHHGS